MNKKIAVFGLMTLFLCISVLASNGQGNLNSYQSTNANEISKMEQHQNKFENKYNFSCEEECNYGLNNKEQVTLQVRETRRFLFWDIVAESNLILNEEGEVTEFAQNIWARLFGVESFVI